MISRSRRIKVINPTARKLQIIEVMATLIIRLNQNTVGTQPALNFNDSPTVTFEVSNNPATQAVDVKATATVAGTTTLDGMFGLIQAVTDTTYTLMVRAAYAGAITAVGTRMGAGTCTVEVRINGTPLGGSSNSATSTYSEQAHATDNVFAVDDIITMVITASAASPADLDFVLKMVRIL